MHVSAGTTCYGENLAVGQRTALAELCFLVSASTKLCSSMSQRSAVLSRVVSTAPVTLLCVTSVVSYLGLSIGLQHAVGGREFISGR